MPLHVDLTPQCPVIYDQGQLGSCTSQAIAAAIEFDLMKQKLPDFMPSRLFIYYNERAVEGTINTDSGAMIRDGIKSVASLGVCPESEWIYDINTFTQKPTPICYTDALKNRAVSYSRLPNNRASLLKLCLANGIPFVFGFSVYESFESQEVAHTGVVPLPQANEQLLGGHAVLCVGFSQTGYDDTSVFICRNSWGTNWGNKGYFTMPFKYLTNPNLADDFWAIKVIT
jgi:C1A family cysteine protease